MIALPATLQEKMVLRKWNERYFSWKYVKQWRHQTRHSVVGMGCPSLYKAGATPPTVHSQVGSKTKESSIGVCTWRETHIQTITNQAFIKKWSKRSGAE